MTAPAAEPLPAAVRKIHLYCPACAYPLLGVAEAGLNSCPQCGAPVDLDELCRARTEGIDAGSQRVTGFAAAASVPMVIGTAVMLCGVYLKAMEAPMAIAVPFVAVGVATYVVAGLWWMWILVRAVQAETRGLDASATPAMALANPVLALSVLGHVVFFSVLIALVSLG